MGFRIDADTKDFAPGGYVRAEDVLRLRREVFQDGIVDLTEAEELISLGDQLPEGDPEWKHFYLEALTDYFVIQKHPSGYMSDEDATYLLGRMGPADLIFPMKHALLIKLLSFATYVPAKLINYAFSTVLAHVIDDGYISEAEVEALRTFLFAAGGDGNIAITRAEAKFMFDINDRVRGAHNAPGWSLLFSQGIANYLMAHIGYVPPSRAEALRRHEWLEEDANIGNFFKKMVSGGLSGLTGNLDDGSNLRADHNHERDIAIKQAAVLTSKEADWLCERIGKDGVYDEAEKAIISHLKSLNGNLPGSLQHLVDAA